MGLRHWCPLFLVAAAFLLGGCTDSASHSLRFFYTTTWDSDKNLFHFLAVGYLDDQIVFFYNTDTRMAEPRLSWFKKLEKDDPHFWNRNIHIIRSSELRMKGDLSDLLNLYNWSGGMHTWQHMNGCELGKEGRKSGFLQYAYDGEDFLSFDKEALTWTAAVVPAQVLKRQWDADLIRSHRHRSYLEEECVEWLQKFLDYGKDSLLRRECPTVKVALKASYNGLETLVCRAHGFHPKEIDATWRKDGQVWEQETFCGGVIPNSDGTYHTWLNVTIDPKDRDHYRCHVEHDSLPEPLDLAWEEPGERRKGIIKTLIIPISLVAILVIGATVAAVRSRFIGGDKKKEDEGHEEIELVGSPLCGSDRPPCGLDRPGVAEITSLRLRSPFKVWIAPPQLGSFLHGSDYPSEAQITSPPLGLAPEMQIVPLQLGSAHHGSDHSTAAQISPCVDQITSLRLRSTPKAQIAPSKHRSFPCGTESALGQLGSRLCSSDQPLCGSDRPGVTEITSPPLRLAPEVQIAPPQLRSAHHGSDHSTAAQISPCVDQITLA